MERFKGKVKKLIESKREVARGKREKRVSMISEKNFDREGHLVEERFRQHKHINRITYKYNRRGNCTERTEYDYERVRFFRYKYKYDRWGNQIEELCMDPDGTVTQTSKSRFSADGHELEKRLRKGASTEQIRYEYDANGFLLEEYHLENGQFNLRRSYRYDQHGNKSEETFLESNGEKETLSFVYTYDSNDKIIEEIVSGNNQQTRFTFAYDANGRAIQRCQYASNGNFTGSATQYDSQGNKIEERWFNSESKSCGRVSFCRNDAGLLLEEAMYHGAMKPQTQEVVIENNEIVQHVRYGNMEESIDYQIRHTYDKDGNEEECTETHFDSLGNVIQSSHRLFSSNGNILEESIGNQKETFTYDISDNWVRKESFINGILKEVIEREFEYWDS